MNPTTNPTSFNANLINPNAGNLRGKSLTRLAEVHANTLMQQTNSVDTPTIQNARQLSSQDARNSSSKGLQFLANMSIIRSESPDQDVRNSDSKGLTMLADIVVNENNQVKRVSFETPFSSDEIKQFIESDVKNNIYSITKDRKNVLIEMASSKLVIDKVIKYAPKVSGNSNLKNRDLRRLVRIIQRSCINHNGCFKKTKSLDTFKKHPHHIKMAVKAAFSIKERVGSFPHYVSKNAFNNAFKIA